MLKTHRADGTPVTCKFCRAPVAYDEVTARVMDLAGGFHSDRCERRKAFFKNEAALRNQARRDTRFREEA